MRKSSLAMLYVLGTIVLFASAASKPVPRGIPCPPCCFPCSEPSAVHLPSLMVQP
jgi:hypothetical protein